MSVGEGSIKRAAKTANAGTKEPAVTGKKSNSKKSEKNVVQKSTDTHEAYGIGQELPIYLL